MPRKTLFFVPLLLAGCTQPITVDMLIKAKAEATAQIEVVGAKVNTVEAEIRDVKMQVGEVRMQIGGSGDTIGLWLAIMGPPGTIMYYIFIHRPLRERRKKRNASCGEC